VATKISRTGFHRSAQRRDNAFAAEKLVSPSACEWSRFNTFHHFTPRRRGSLCDDALKIVPLNDGHERLAASLDRQRLGDEVIGAPPQ
jgi:hypothetical protein